MMFYETPIGTLLICIATFVVYYWYNRRRPRGKPRFWLERPCHDCDAKAGERHELGCDMERCPICDPVKEQPLITCKHYDIVAGGGIHRIPYIQPLVHCAVCNELFPDFFNVPDEEWDKYVIPVLQHMVLCLDCYEAMKELFPEGWRNAI